MFRLPANELRKRRGRAAPIVGEVEKLPAEYVSHCSVCGSGERAVIANQDRYGCPIRTALCHSCGLIYSIDRLTQAGFSKFYASGVYRRLIDSFKGSDSTVRNLQASQVFYAKRLSHTLAAMVDGNGKSVLDVGGSTGIVALEFARRFGFHPVVIDPSPEEVEGARQVGVEAYVGTAEDFETDEKFDLVLLCRTVEHVFDLGATLRQLRRWVKDDGFVYADFSDYMEVCRREGPPEATAKIDHCYWLMQETAVNILKSAGFEVAMTNITMSAEQVGFLLRPAQPAPLESVPADQLNAWLRSFRGFSTDWEQDSLEQRGWIGGLRASAYSMKKRLTSISSQIRPLPALPAQRLDAPGQHSSRGE